MSAFISKLAAAVARSQSRLCVGLDPITDSIPTADAFEFLSGIIEVTKESVCAYKPNLAFFEQFGAEGATLLEKVLREIPSDLVVIGDAKRGDIASSSAGYARALFDWWGFDAVTVNPYLGRDALEPFLSRTDRGVFVLCRTSNPGAHDFQDLVVCGPDGTGRTPLYLEVARQAEAWNSAGNIGLVVGATAPPEVQQVRRECPEMPLLLPGVGAQGGDLIATVSNASGGGGAPFILSVSRQVLYPTRGPGSFREAARDEARMLKGQINAALQGAMSLTATGL